MKIQWVRLVSSAAVLASFAFTAASIGRQTEGVRAIAAPSNPLPAEAESAGVTKFSFIAYGDTRGQADGVELQLDHSLVVSAVLDAIKRLASTDHPVRFVLQSGDAVTSGRVAAQWDASFTPIIERITKDAGVPYFLAPGNHDLTSAMDLSNPQRQLGLKNYLAAVANSIPPDGSPRRLAGYPTFSFGYGNTFVVSIDSNIAGDAKQLDWTKRQLEGLDRSRFTNVVALMHHPVFSSGPHGGPRGIETQTQFVRDLYMPLFRAHHVRLVLAGHDHLLEHWIERYADSSGNPGRMDLVVTAGGGAPPYYYEGDPDTNSYERTYAKEQVHLERLVKPGTAPGSNPFHFLIVQVDGTSFSIDAVAANPNVTFKPYGTSPLSLGVR